MKYDVFISYSRSDYVTEDGSTPDPKKIVSKLLKVFDENDLTYWIDREGIYSGEQFANVIAEAIRESTLFLFVSTKTSNQSIWTAGEISTAREYNKTIIPFRADNTPFHESVIVYLAPLHHINYALMGDKALGELVNHLDTLLGAERQKKKDLKIEWEALQTELEQKLEQRRLLLGKMRDADMRMPANDVVEGQTGEHDVQVVLLQGRLAKLQDENEKLKHENQRLALLTSMTKKEKKKGFVQSIIDSVKDTHSKRNPIVTMVLAAGLIANIATSLIYLFDCTVNAPATFDYMYLARDIVMVFSCSLNSVIILQLLLNRLDYIMCFFGAVILAIATSLSLNNDMALGLLVSLICYSLIIMPLMFKKDNQTGFSILQDNATESKAGRLIVYFIYGIITLVLCLFLLALLIRATKDIF